MFDNVFKNDLSTYNGKIEPVKQYVMQAATYLSKTNGLSINENIARVKKILKNHNIKNPLVKYYGKDENSDKIVVEEKLTDYIASVTNENNIITPSFTMYMHPTVKTSVHSEFLDDNIKMRNVHKHKALEFKQLKDDDKYAFHETLQKTMKNFNNNFSGTYASPSTVFFNPTAHYSLTSTTRTVTSIGNAISEAMVAGSFYFKNVNVTLGYITTVCVDMDRAAVKLAMDKYNLYVPNAEDVFEFILTNSRKYWSDEPGERKIYDLLNRLDTLELTGVLYLNNLYGIATHNEVFAKEFISKISARKTNGSVDNLKDIDNAPDGIMNLVHHICSEDIKGMKVNYKELVGTDTLMVLASTAREITINLMEYNSLIKAFFVTKIMPPTIAYIKDTLRECIVLSDTDSTCATYGWWVEWYFGKQLFTPEAVGVSAAVMTINTQTMDHYIKYFASIMNIDKSAMKHLAMKNEYYWDIFTSTNVSKHYFANVRIREGVVYGEPDLELKGVHLIASSVQRKIVKRAHDDIIKDIHTTLARGDKIELSKYIKIVADTERDIIADIKSGSSSIFKVNKIKGSGAYKLDATKSPYFHHMLWEEVFAEKYGSPGEPTYMVINITSEISSKRMLSEFLETIQDIEIRDKLSNFLAKHNKTTLGTFRVPLSIVREKGVPIELYGTINYYKTVTNAVNIMYLILESFHFYRKPNLLISEMGY